VLTNHVVLVVDDDEDIREAIVAALEDFDIPVETAENGEDALRKLKNMSTKPAVILLDLMMPTMDGWAFRRAQLALPEFASIPVVVFSAHAEITDIGLDLHAKGWLKKPVDMYELLSAVGGKPKLAL